MAQNTPVRSDGAKAPSALEKETARVDTMMAKGKDGEAGKRAREGENGMNNPVQVEQDNRVEKARADAAAAGGGPDKPEPGLNQDG